jgi:hypothetical protein
MRLVIWDETPMTNRQCFEALDWNLRDMLCTHDVGRASFVWGQDNVFG